VANGFRLEKRKIGMNEDVKQADQTEVKVSELMTPEWANLFGNIHGGHVLSQVDNIAYVCAARYSRMVCVTAAFDRVDFHEPIHVGELVTYVARITYVGRSSMEVEINVYAEDITTGNVRHTNTCNVTMVALKDGKPAQVPRLECRTREDKVRFIQARMRRDLSKRYQADRRAFLAQVDAMDDATLDALMSGEQPIGKIKPG
jgi:acyl-CoA hydrolase